MARSIIAVIVSYILMFVLTFLMFTGVYMVLHADGSFKPGSFEASNLWIAIAFGVNLVIAVIGGLVCAAIARGGKAPLVTFDVDGIIHVKSAAIARGGRGGKAPLVLAIVVFILGLLLAIPSLVAQKTNAGLVRSGDVPMMEAMQRAKEPIWVPLLFPFVGVAGVLIGGKLKRRG